MMKNILFVSSAIQQPRHQRRASTLSRCFNITMLYNIRDAYKVNIKSLGFKSIFLGNISRKNGFIRYVFCRGASNIKLFIYFLLYQRKSVLYLTSPDQALVAIIARKVFFIEYGDIQSLSNNSNASRILDKIICKYAKGIIVTSPAYISGYFSKFNEPRSKFCIAENKVPRAIADMIKKNGPPPRDTIYNKFSKVRLGLVGVIKSYGDLHDLSKNYF